MREIPLAEQQSRVQHGPVRAHYHSCLCRHCQDWPCCKPTRLGISDLVGGLLVSPCKKGSNVSPHRPQIFSMQNHPFGKTVKKNLSPAPSQ